MRILILIIMLQQLCYAQDTYKSQNKIRYKGTGVFMEVVEPESGKTIIVKPIGNEVEVTYDKFFKSYDIIYTDENGKRKKTELRYMGEAELEGLGAINVMDKFEKRFVLVDAIAEKKMLIYIGAVKERGFMMRIVIEGLIIAN